MLGLPRRAGGEPVLPAHVLGMLLARRLHIDKAMLQNWREHYAQLVREQGIAANTHSSVPPWPEQAQEHRQGAPRTSPWPLPRHAGACEIGNCGSLRRQGHERPRTRDADSDAEDPRRVMDDGSGHLGQTGRNDSRTFANRLPQGTNRSRATRCRLCPP
jgi:hypothetical protein